MSTMTIDVLYQFINYITRKDPIGGHISDQEFTNLCQIASFKYFKKLFGLPEEYQKGSERARVGFGLNSILEDKLRPLKAKATLTIAATGLANYPTDYFRYDSLYISDVDESEYIQIIPFNDQEFDEIIGAPVGPPSDTNIICNFQATQIEFRPKNITSATMRYIKYPRSPIRGYVIDYETAESVYVGRGAYLRVLTTGSAGDTITVFKDGSVQLGTYTVLSEDTIEDIMIALKDAVNVNTIVHKIKAVYDGEKIVFIDQIGTNVFLVRNLTGGITVTSTDFSAWSTQFDWENDIESMNDIAEIILDMIGVSNQNINLVQWAEKGKQND